MTLFKKLLPLKQHLLSKLLLINLILVLVVTGFIWFAIDYLAASYFSSLMQQYHISPDEAHGMFVMSVHRYLLIATTLGISLVILLNFFLTRRVLAPITEMSRIIQHMAKGNYHERVHARVQDEIGQLADAFNHLADRLERVEKLRHDMVDDVSHELRTPLTNIRGYLEGLQDNIIPPSPETLGILTNEVNRLIDLVEGLTRITRANASKGHLNYATVDINHLLQEVFTLYRQRTDSRQLQLDYSPPDTVQLLQADRNLLLQVISNLFDNASQYTPEKGWVKLELEDNNHSLTFSLSNHCEPLGQDELSLLTERFYRSEKSRSRHSGGAGIGLTIVKQLVEAHQGSLALTSLADGLRVDFTLPKQPDISIS